MTDGMKSRMNALVTAGMLATTAATAFGQAGTDGIAREAIGARADRLAEMELQPFDETLWGKLGEWSGTPIKAADTNGKVVLIGSWASWNSTSTRALAAMDRMAKQHADDGLIVLGLHHDTGWENAAASASRVSFPTAHDTKNAWRTALDIDQDPDFYLIDRSGQLRFADIHTSSLGKAVDLLLNETVTEAAGRKDALMAEAEAAEREFRKTRSISRDAAAMEIPAVSFVMPGPEAFNEVDWPESSEMKKDDNNRRRGEEEWVPQSFTLPPQNLYPPTPPQTNGKILVVYFWDHDFKGRSREVMKNVLAEMDLLARRYGRDVEVLGLLTKFQDQNNRGNRNEDDDWDPAKLKSVIEQNHRVYNLHHSLLIDEPGYPLQQLLQSPVSQGQRGGSRDANAWPYAAIVTTDGSIRWGGFVGKEYRQISNLAGYDEFILALQRMIDRDPGVKARRKAEDAYIRANGGG